MNFNSIQNTLAKYSTLGLKEINSLSLQNRIDTKYILNIDELPNIFEKLKTIYQLVNIDGFEIHHYANIYFDTENNQLFNNHHNGKLNRYKVRKRRYIKSNLSFLEIKLKTNKGVTKKCRVETDNFTPTLNSMEKEFIKNNSTLNTDLLEPKIFSDFHRVTLVNFDTNERVTFDLKLDGAGMNADRTTFNNLAIIEVKQDKSSGKSKLIELLKAKGINNPSSFSKYCIVRTQLDKTLKYNTFKPILLYLQKINIHDVIS